MEFTILMSAQLNVYTRSAVKYAMRCLFAHCIFRKM
jgi:hypothetical protein